ncbi:hypothetical protein LCI18_002052 [Fusarium solani-melongenae]|uniref:Uncharacterized protein n=1 Tax=Fusarium solani subsp. cucurbitae TaxID=2747967 RepID=A0ACD3YQ91_FUSSC|nr:hypothetical protein LCI18_002052 [Fusarium solani-melongenae]
MSAPNNSPEAVTTLILPLQITTSVPDLPQLWTHLRPTISNNILTLQGEQYKSLDQGGKSFLASMMIAHINQPVLYAIDANSDHVYLGPPRDLTSGQGMLVNATGATEAIWMIRPSIPMKIPRPPNAYIIYRKERHHLVKEMHPGITNNEISQILGRCWNLETRDTRAQYKLQADEAKRLHYEKYPDYQYRPRRPSKKRRRAAPSASTDLARAVQNQ